MKVDLNQNEINQLENVLITFKREWEQQQSARAAKWRFDFLISVVVCVLVSSFLPLLWWVTIIVIAYFAGSLYTMLRLRVKTNQQIIEHQKQLRLVKLLRKFGASPYSTSYSANSEKEKQAKE